MIKSDGGTYGWKRNITAILIVNFAILVLGGTFGFSKFHQAKENYTNLHYNVGILLREHGLEWRSFR